MIDQQQYQKKFQVLEPFLGDIIGSIRKELKNEHLKKDYSFCQKYFTKTSVDKISLDDLVNAYSQELNNGNEELEGFVSSKWILRNGEIYHFFAEALSKINPKFDEIEMLSDEQGKDLMAQAVDQFGSTGTYIFSILNSVMFSDSVIADLRNLALLDAQKGSIARDDEKEESPEKIKLKHLQEIHKITDKYEKKILGICKKYTHEIEGLKKQIATLQRKLQGGAVDVRR